MRWGFHDQEFYFEYDRCARPPGNMREETERRARELYALNTKIIISLSGGLDSQSMVYSFLTQAIPFTAVFMFLPGYNNQELKNIRHLQRLWNFPVEIVRMDPQSLREQIEDLADEQDCHPLAQLHSLFLQQLPQDHDFVQMTHDPFVYVSSTGRRYWLQSWYDMETTKQRVFSQLARQGQYRAYGDSTEFLLSVINDPIYRAAISAHRYFDHNGLSKNNCYLTTVDRYDYYIKPLLYARYWGDELQYFGKLVGDEEIPWLRRATVDFRRRGIMIDYDQFIQDLSTEGEPMRYFHNMPAFNFL